MGISLKELKKNRMTPAEKWVLETIEGAKKPEIQQSGNVRWYKDYNLLFEQDFKNGYLCVSYRYICLVLRNDFGLNDDEIKHMLSNLLYDYTDNGKLKVW